MRWLEEAVLEGLQMLLTLRLPGAPAADTIAAGAEVWIGAFKAGRNIGWDERADRPRIRQAFLAVCAKVDRWPAPSRVLDELPPRVLDRSRALAMPPKPLPPAIREQLVALLERLRLPDPERPPIESFDELDWPALAARLTAQQTLRRALEAPPHPSLTHGDTL